MDEKNVLLFLIDDFEEIEALSTVDILRRGGVSVKTVSMSNSIIVKGVHGINVEADIMFEDCKGDDFHMLVFPGGSGALNFIKNDALVTFVKKANENHKYISAICAAPTFLAEIGLLDGKTCVCYPGMENMMKNAIIGQNPVEMDGNIITSKAPATSPSFAFKILEVLMGREKSQEIYNEMHYNLVFK